MYEFFNSHSENKKWSHAYHRYPAKFIPPLVEKLIKDNLQSKSGTVLDPFGGCGTTIVEARMLGHKAIGLDINPVAKMISKAKIAAISPKIIENAKKKLVTEINKNNCTSKPHSERIHYWFSEKQIKNLDNIYNAIWKISESTSRLFFLCCFSHILKNCSRWLMASIKPTIDRNKSEADTFNVFIKHVNLMEKRNENYFQCEKKVKNLRKAKFFKADATSMKVVKSSSVDLIVTSPPYSISYEYSDIHQLTFEWFADDTKNFMSWNKLRNKKHEYKKSFVGSKTRRTKKRPTFIPDLANKIVDSISKIDSSFAEGVNNYFIDMAKTMQSANRCLVQNGRICLVVGDTEFKGVKIQNSSVIMECAKIVNLTLIQEETREISNKLICPNRDSSNGKFSSDTHSSKKTYSFEKVLIFEKRLIVA